MLTSVTSHLILLSILDVHSKLVSNMKRSKSDVAPSKKRAYEVTKHGMPGKQYAGPNRKKIRMQNDAGNDWETFQMWLQC